MKDGIALTREEAESLHDFIECGFIEFIKEAGDEIDNMKWLYHICNIWKKCDDLMFGKEHEDVKMDKPGKP